MLIQSPITCGYCEEPLEHLDATEHFCYERELHDSYEPAHRPFTYSASALMAAEAFLTQYPEFKEHQNLYAHNRIGAYSSPEEEDYSLPQSYTTADHFPIEEPFTNEVTRETEWDGIFLNRDNYQREALNYWRDVEPTRCTSAIYWWSNRANMPGYPTAYGNHHMARNFTLNETYAQKYQGLDYSEPALARYEFEELQGFASQQLIDLNITEKYAFRFFNIFVGNDQHLHVGLLTITDEHVTCSRKDCYFRRSPLPIPTDPTREQMETFVHALIRHGNNHGPDWYIKREDFAYIHAENCDTNHDHSSYCNTNVSLNAVDLMTLEGSLDFLIRHRKFCRDNNCRCGAYYHTLSHYLRERSLVAA